MSMVSFLSCLKTSNQRLAVITPTKHFTLVKPDHLFNIFPAEDQIIRPVTVQLRLIANGVGPR